MSASFWYLSKDIDPGAAKAEHLVRQLLFILCSGNIIGNVAVVSAKLSHLT